MFLAPATVSMSKHAMMLVETIPRISIAKRKALHVLALKERTRAL